MCGNKTFLMSDGGLKKMLSLAAADDKLQLRLVSNGKFDQRNYNDASRL